MCINIKYMIIFSPYYEIAYLYQSIMYIISTFVNISLDSFFVGLMAHISVQLDQLYDTSLQIYENATTTVVSKQKIDSKNPYNKKEVFCEMQRNIVGCVKHHINILQLVATFIVLVRQLRCIFL